MNIPSFNQLRKISSSRYGLVMLVSKRSRKLVDGNDPLIKTKHEKPVSIAIEEIIDGAVKFGEPMSDKEYLKKIEAQKEAKLNKLRNNDESELDVDGVEQIGEDLIES
ncbi:DNA-directed RNA polymerase subunit omega [Peptoniphilus asaccharolyticus DSM 20463]|uniref:DNA-directed RNA polymerase subunit omega n=1 Tax=Peptoniphilus asaccharolyticus DSM 20463 TaxID=573058 RepID=A0A1W1UW96_PEPAS|nr:DNA-directed RNA polymerase subunit omega [Peptoniphilus asaccharolyticus]MBL7575281.1 DNA-directed RNA polymerase subunit omega [Peptoniphilus asaccharolyticus]SMB85367.1 DNA-directed RNA polymerase subunit omega [Peptoniphilus asaccharolyticus DSM 20463]